MRDKLKKVWNKLRPSRKEVKGLDKTAENLGNCFNKLPRIVQECFKVAIGERSIMDHESKFAKEIKSGRRPNPKIANGTHS